MASSDHSAEVYDTDRFGELYLAASLCSIDDLARATRFLMTVFRQADVPFAFLGGWAIYLRGGGRTTQDVDVAVSSPMADLKAILLRQSRVCVPEVHGQTSIQIFLKPSRSHPNTSIVSIDIIMAGNLGAPLLLQEATDAIVPVPRTPLGDTRVPLIDVVHQFSAKLQAYEDRRGNAGTKDYDDLVYLTQIYYQTVGINRYTFNERQRMMFYADATAANPELGQWLLDVLF